MIPLIVALDGERAEYPEPDDSSTKAYHTYDGFLYGQWGDWRLYPERQMLRRIPGGWDFTSEGPKKVGVLQSFGDGRTHYALIDPQWELAYDTNKGEGKRR